MEDGYDYQPMDQHLAINLVEAAFNEPLIDGVDKTPWDAFIDGMFDRAATVLEMSDESLMQIEADLQNMTVAQIPVENKTASNAAPRNSDHNLRNEMKAGNLQLASSSVDESDSPRDKKRASIRQAVGTTKVASSRANFGV